jgi:hypothetical protein
MLVLRMGEFNNLLQVLNLAILPEAVVLGSDSAICSDSRGFNAAQTRPSLNNSTHMSKVPPKVMRGSVSKCVRHPSTLTPIGLTYMV